eukprot:5480823-Amphidinium_carterae.1
MRGVLQASGGNTFRNLSLQRESEETVLRGYCDVKLSTAPHSHRSCAKTSLAFAKTFQVCV